jgi:hypothetical protein
MRSSKYATFELHFPVFWHPLELCLLHFNKVDARKQENAAQKWHILKNASVVLVG